MLDRAIGIWGVAIALIIGLWPFTPKGWPKMPPWLTILGMGFGVFLTGLAGGMIISDQRNSSEDPSANKFVFHDEPPRIVVSKKTFTNERVLLDGHAYRDCTFENVTFVYNGTAPIEMTGNSIRGRFRLTTENPGISSAYTLMRGIGLLNQAEFRNESGSIVEPPTIGQPPEH